MSTTDADVRRLLVPQVNAVTRDEQNQERTPEDVRRDLEASFGQAYTTAELQAAFEAEGFAAPLIIVRRRSDGVRGSLVFTHHPRFYHSFTPRNS